ncbi:hypothetical protein [Thermoflexibacter ruber]|uniref:Uncharacterized protein n=1 Tax=Thermoflexibacter ruber TaxID=1003 RepID=A0A1I2HND0_9BACT|nr:hypothetical protein [Thermoflexibacter ruber]SFF31855.1 hypothetical protein SAMN04488541_102556 [Thermoflexibacter ruber]
MDSSKLDLFPEIIISTVSELIPKEIHEIEAYSNYIDYLIDKLKNTADDSKISHIIDKLFSITNQLKNIKKSDAFIMSNIENVINNYIVFLEQTNFSNLLENEKLIAKYKKEFNLLNHFFNNMSKIVQEYSINTFLLSFNKGIADALVALCKIHTVNIHPFSIDKISYIQDKEFDWYYKEQIIIQHDELELLKLDSKQKYENITNTNKDINKELKALLLDGFDVIRYVEDLCNRIENWSVNKNTYSNDRTELFEIDVIIDLQNRLLKYLNTYHILFPINTFDKLVEAMKLRKADFIKSLQDSHLKVLWFLKTILLYSLINLQKDLLNRI